MSEVPSIRILESRLAERPIRMRLPFQFGDTEVRETAEIYAELRVEAMGREVVGRSAQLMVPRWFDKRPELDNAATVDELRNAARAASDVALGRSGSVAEVVSSMRSEVPGRLDAAVPPLAAGFGPALIEMAVIDAACQAAALPFWQAARADLFGLGAHCPPDLSREVLLASLERIVAPRRIALRHTVGFDAPLRREDADGPDDGLPVSVEEVAAATGIRSWKIKLKGSPDADLARLRDVAALLDAGPEYTATLDANEQYAPDAFAALLDGLGGPDLERLRARLRFVEQPFPRETALDTDVGGYGIQLVSDESDDRDDAFPAAIRTGWSGTSIKSCKGVLRALRNRARADAADKLLSGEDLTCQPGLCWRQDTAMAAACGVPDVERNGHHFAGGMQGASDEEREATLRRHPDIFAMGSGGRPALRIEGGAVTITSLDYPGFGASSVVAMASD